MAQLADILRPYFEYPRWQSIVIRGLEDQETGPPQHVIQPSWSGRPTRRFATKCAPLRYSNFRTEVWRPTLERLKLPAVGLHVLRHSAAARLIGAGASAKAVHMILGHGSAAFTLTVYGHLFDADLDALADALDVSAAGRARDRDSELDGGDRALPS
jgi:integrase